MYGNEFFFFFKLPSHSNIRQVYINHITNLSPCVSSSCTDNFPSDHSFLYFLLVVFEIHYVYCLKNIFLVVQGVLDL